MPHGMGREAAIYGSDLYRSRIMMLSGYDSMAFLSFSFFLANRK